MNKVTFEEIKTRVEYTIASKLDRSEFISFANQVISEINEESFLQGPVIRYTKDQLKSGSEYFNSRLYDAGAVNNIITLPFTYNVGSNMLDVSFASQFAYTHNEVGNFGEVSNQIELVGTIIDDQSTISVTNVELMNGETDSKVMLMDLPSNYSSMIKLEGYKNGKRIEFRGISVTSLSEGNAPDNINWDYVYYHYQEGKIAIIGANYIDQFRLYYTKIMRPVQDTDTLSVLTTELPQGFENIITYAVAQRYFSNFYGPESNRTIAMGNERDNLRSNFMQNNVSKRRANRQSAIKMG